MKRRQPPTNLTSAQLPVISNGVLKRSFKKPPDFNSLYMRLRETNPGAAGWLLAATDKFAPANGKEKEKYAEVALLLYDMLLQQQDINELSAKFGSLEIRNRNNKPCTHRELRTSQASETCENCSEV
jgi:hypothetical protein